MSRLLLALIAASVVAGTGAIVLGPIWLGVTVTSLVAVGWIGYGLLAWRQARHARALAHKPRVRKSSDWPLVFAVKGQDEPAKPPADDSTNHPSAL